MAALIAVDLDIPFVPEPEPELEPEPEQEHGPTAGEIFAAKLHLKKENLNVPPRSLYYELTVLHCGEFVLGWGSSDMLLYEVGVAEEEAKKAAKEQAELEAFDISEFRWCKKCDTWFKGGACSDPEHPKYCWVKMPKEQKAKLLDENAAKLQTATEAATTWATKAEQAPGAATVYSHTKAGVCRWAAGDVISAAIWRQQVWMSSCEFGVHFRAMLWVRLRLPLDLQAGVLEVEFWRNGHSIKMMKRADGDSNPVFCQRYECCA
eukprot:SAG11_NODE_516_length_8817_cov_2.360977_5_plen_263_part_00